MSHLVNGLQPTQNTEITIFIHSTLKDNWIHETQPGTTKILSPIRPRAWYNGPPLTNSLDDEQEIKRIQRLLVLHFHLKTLENNCNHPMQNLRSSFMFRRNVVPIAQKWRHVYLVPAFKMRIGSAPSAPAVVAIYTCPSNNPIHKQMS